MDFSLADYRIISLWHQVTKGKVLPVVSLEYLAFLEFLDGVLEGETPLSYGVTSKPTWAMMELPVVSIKENKVFGTRSCW